MNTPTIRTERLILRKFCSRDIDALFSIFSDKEVNTYLPWFPLETMQEAKQFFEDRYIKAYERSQGCGYAVCLKADDIPIGYVNLSADESHDLGYGLSKAFWHKGITTEACRAVIERARRDRIPYITATHDVNNLRSGSVMQALGMRYQYTYLEQWQPKGIPVRFRLYQMNLDGDETRVYRKYWEQYPVHYVEEI